MRLFAAGLILLTLTITAWVALANAEGKNDVPPVPPPPIKPSYVVCQDKRILPVPTYLQTPTCQEIDYYSAPQCGQNLKWTELRVEKMRKACGKKCRKL